jgi:uncharacterized lipoprotein YajG
MSTDNALPAPEQAFGHLFDSVHQEVFVNKLAAAGMMPKSAEELQGYYELAGKLRAANEHPAVKQAAAQESKVAELNASLDSVLADMGVDSGVKEAAEQEADLSYQQAAAYLAQDPSIYNSVLSVKLAQAQAEQELAAAMQQQ